jgi:membrane-associated phospholipid phosphatase
LKYYVYDWAGCNVWLFHLINNWRGPLLDRVMLLGTQISDYRNFPFYVTAIAFIGIVVARREAPVMVAEASSPTDGWLRALAVFCAAYLVDGLLLTVAKPLLDFPRPSLALGFDNVHVVGPRELRFSLPSGHASFVVTLIAATWTVLSRSGRTVGTLFIGWVCVSRVNVGAHFPADVIASIVTALAIALIVRVAILTIATPSARSQLGCIGRGRGNAFPR